MSLSSIYESSRLNPALAMDVTIKKSAFTIMRKTKDVCSVPTHLRCASMQRLINALKGPTALKLTIESSHSITRRSTRRSFARKARRRAVTLEIYARSHIARTSCRLIYFIDSNKTRISICSISRLSGAHLMTKFELTCAMSVNMRTIGKIIGENLTHMNTLQRNNVGFGALRRRRGLILTDVT